MHLPPYSIECNASIRGVTLPNDIQCTFSFVPHILMLASMTDVCTFNASGEVTVILISNATGLKLCACVVGTGFPALWHCCT